MRVSRAGDFCGDEAGKRKGGCAAGCRKRASARLFGRAEEGRAVGVAKVQAECRRGAASFSRRKEPNAADVAKAIYENGKRCSAQAERGKRADARREWFWYGITSPLMRCNRGKRASSLLSPTHAAVRTKGVRGNAGALGESRACGLALCGFCRGGVHLIFVEEGLSIFCRRVRTARKGCRAGCGGDGFWRRSAEAGAGRCCCCCCCARRTRAALDLGNAAAGERRAKTACYSPVRAAFTAKAVSFLLCSLKIMCLYGG